MAAIVYLDNSHIFVSAQYYSYLNQQAGNQDRFPVGQNRDLAFRVNFSGLLQCILGPRKANKKYAYERMQGKVKDAMNKSGFQVFCSKSRHDDSAGIQKLCVDATKQIRSKGQPGTLIFLGGNKLLVPVIQLAIKHKWDVEVWAFKCTSFSLESEVKALGVSIKGLEGNFSKIQMVDSTEDDGIPSYKFNKNAEPVPVAEDDGGHEFIVKLLSERVAGALAQTQSETRVDISVPGTSRRSSRPSF